MSAAHCLDGRANQVGGGAWGEGRTESGHMLLVSTGRDGRGRGRERTAISHPARRVAPGGPVERFVAPGLRALFSFPAVGSAPGWVGRWCFGRSGRSVLSRPRATCGASRRSPVPLAVRVRTSESTPVCLPRPGYKQPPGRIRL